MATKRIIQLPTLNNGQVTGGNSSQGGYLRRLPNELPGGDGPNPKRVIQTPQTDANGNITGGGGKKIAMNSPEEPEVWTYKGNNGVVQTIDKRVQQGGQPATTYGSKTDRSAALLNTGKNGATNGLPQATPAGLPGITKYAGQDKTAGGIKYGNNQAGIDLVNKQGSTEMLTAGESAQRTAGQYEKMPLPGQKIANVIKYQDNSDGTTTQYLDDGTSEIVRLVRNVDGTYSTQDVGQPAPTVATTQNPVIKKTLDKPQEQTVTPAVLQGADMNTLNSTLDELNYKVNVEGKALSKDEYLAYASAKRQLQDMMKPQALTGGLDGLIANKEQDIKQATDESKINNEQELADFTKSQEVYKQAELDNIQKSFEREQETMRLILAGQGAGQGTFAVDKLNELSQNNQQKISILNEAVQAKIDLYGSQLRKDSQATIEAMKTRLDNFYLKAADLDVKNIEMVNAYNKEQGADKIKQLDGLMALAQSQALSSKQLTPEEQKQVDTFANNLYDENGDFRDDVFKMLKEINPNLANLAVYNGGAIQKQRIADNLAMKGLDADIKRAQLNKLLNPDVDYKVTANDDGTYTRTGSDGSVAIVNPVGSTDIGGLSGSDLAKTLASGKIDGKKFFGVYATGDPDGTQFASIYNKASEQGLDAYMKSRQDRGSKITADMVNQAAIATGVDPITIAAKMAQDSGMGTQGKGARNNNPGNVGQFDSLDAKGITVKGYSTLEDGVLAVANNFKKRQDALQGAVGSRGLSSVAKEAVKSGQINGTPTVQSGIIKELADAGEFDKGQGNSTFYTAKDTVKNEIASFAEGYAKRQQAKQIFNKLKADGTLGGATGWFDTLANKGKRFAGAGSTDVNNLNQILAESLSKYMNKISGATVSETEVERLREQIPNLSMGDKQFADAFEQYDLSMQRGLDNTLTKYGFNSYDDVKQKIYGDNKSEQPQGQTQTTQTTVSPQVENDFTTYFQ